MTNTTAATDRSDRGRLAWETRRANRKVRQEVDALARLGEPSRTRRGDLQDVLAFLRAAREASDGLESSFERWVILDLAALTLEELGHVRGEVADLTALVSLRPTTKSGRYRLGGEAVLTGAHVRWELRRAARGYPPADSAVRKGYDPEKDHR